MGVKDFAKGEIRYLNYYLRFPNGEECTDSFPFVSELSREIPKLVKRVMVFGNVEGFKRDILQKGEHHFYDKNAVEHLIRVEDHEIPVNWPGKKPSHPMMHN